MSLTQYLVLCIMLLITVIQACQHDRTLRKWSEQVDSHDSNTAINGIRFSVRAHWMRVANQAPLDLVSACPFAPFGTAIVNHTEAGGVGELICIGANNNSATGNPSLHGEIAAINNCTQILADPNGRYKLSPSAVLAAWENLTLYTNAESCPMCASAIRWAGFKEYVYGTSIDFLVQQRWGQITISSQEVFAQSHHLPTNTSYLAGILQNETDPYFSWQFSKTYPCPKGCARNQSGRCSPIPG